MRTKMLCVVAGLVAGCAVDPGDEPDGGRNYELLATFDLPEGGTIELGETSTGGIITMEYAPVEAPSVMNYYTRRYDATPLELFTALAPDAEVPPALIAAHARQVAAEHRASAEPRRLPPPPDKTTADTNYNWYYAADCSLAEDGGWFDDFWDTYNWSYHWYHRVTDFEDSSPFVATQNVQIHLCDDSSTTVHKVMFVEEYDNGNDCVAGPQNWYNVAYKDLEPQHRAQFRVTADPLTCIYRARGTSKAGSSAHPFWDLGLTMP